MEKRLAYARGGAASPRIRGSLGILASFTLFIGMQCGTWLSQVRRELHQQQSLTVMGLRPPAPLSAMQLAALGMTGLLGVVCLVILILVVQKLLASVFGNSRALGMLWMMTGPLTAAVFVLNYLAFKDFFRNPMGRSYYFLIGVLLVFAWPVGLLLLRRCKVSTSVSEI